MQAPDETNPSPIFWHYLLSKHFFTEFRYFVQIYYTPTSPELYHELHGMSRLNITVKVIGTPPPMATSIICVVESGAPNASRREVERKVFDACNQYTRMYGFRSVWALTTIGTYAKFWRYETAGAPQPRLIPEFGINYTDVGAPESINLFRYFDYMKRSPPA